MKAKWVMMVVSCLMLLIASAAFAETEITALPFTIGSGGSYYINQDFYGIQGYGIEIDNTNDVTIDLRGHIIQGTGTNSGIKIVNVSYNTEVKNGTIRGFHYGIESSYDSAYLRFINLRIIDNNNDGFYIDSSGALVKDCSASYNGGFGIYTRDASVITGNISSSNGSDGIYAYTSTIIGNVVYNNGRDGIRVRNKASSVKNNTAYNNSMNGIYLNGDFGYHLVDGNASYGNGTSGTGVNMTPCANCVFGVNSVP